MKAVSNSFWLRGGYEALTFFGTIVTPSEKIATLQQMSETSPIAYARMGELYTQIGEKEKAARYFIEADKYACLDY